MADFTLTNMDDNPITTLDLGLIAPGEDYITKHGDPAQFKIVNTGAVPFSEVLVGLEAAAGYDSASKAEWAIGASPAYPADYNDLEDGHMDVGPLPLSGEIIVNLQVTEPADAVPEANKVFRIRIEAAE